jgi:hypothetical protein
VDVNALLRTLRGVGGGGPHPVSLQAQVAHLTQVQPPNVQPALVLGALALTLLGKSSELERGVSGREYALRLRELAQAHLDAARDARRIDLGLAQAAMVRIDLLY